MSVYKERLVREALEGAGQTTKGTTAQLVGRLAKYYESNYQDDDLADCTVCKQPSPAALSKCPFCGNDDEVGDKDEGGEVVVARSEEILVEDLDGAIHRYAKAEKEMLGAGWDAGAALKEIRDGRLYLARRDAKGQPVHSSFDNFCRDELKRPGRGCRAFIAISEKFSRADAIAAGMTKLGLLLKVTNEERREELLDKARRPETTVRQLREETKAAVDRSKETKREPVAADSSDSEEEPISEAPPKRITLVAEEGNIQVKFFGASSRPGHRKRAHSFADKPVGVFEFLNDTRMRIRIYQGPNGIYASVTFQELT